jgi:hypothetical protein
MAHECFPVEFISGQAGDGETKGADHVVGVDGSDSLPVVETVPDGHWVRRDFQNAVIGVAAVDPDIDIEHGVLVGRGGHVHGVFLSGVRYLRPKKDRPFRFWVPVMVAG